MGANYAVVSDIIALGVSLTPQQQNSAEILITQASAKLRLTAKKYNKDLDELISVDPDYGEAIKSVIVQSVIRALNSLSDAEPALSQGSETNGNYSISMTYLNAGQSLYFLRNELKELGFMRQTYGAVEMYDLSEG